MCVFFFFVYEGLFQNHQQKKTRVSEIAWLLNLARHELQPSTHQLHHKRAQPQVLKATMSGTILKGRTKITLQRSVAAGSTLFLGNFGTREEFDYALKMWNDKKKNELLSLPSYTVLGNNKKAQHKEAVRVVAEWRKKRSRVVAEWRKKGVFSMDYVAPPEPTADPNKDKPRNELHSTNNPFETGEPPLIHLQQTYGMGKTKEGVRTGTKKSTHDRGLECGVRYLFAPYDVLGSNPVKELMELDGKSRNIFDHCDMEGEYGITPESIRAEQLVDSK